MKSKWPVARKCCGSQWITCLYRTDFVHKHGISYKERRDGFEHDADDIFLLENLLCNPKMAFCHQAWYHYYQRQTSAVHVIDSKRFTSTVKSRYIEMECLNRALSSGYGEPLSAFHYAIIVRRILWELAKHYRIYIHTQTFKKEIYLRECTRIIALVQWNQHINRKSLGFIEPLLNNDLSSAHFRLTNPICVLLDKIRLLPYGL